MCVCACVRETRALVRFWYEPSYIYIHTYTRIIHAGFINYSVFTLCPTGHRATEKTVEEGFASLCRSFLLTRTAPSSFSNPKPRKRSFLFFYQYRSTVLRPPSSSTACITVTTPTVTPTIRDHYRPAVPPQSTLRGRPAVVTATSSIIRIYNIFWK